MSSKVRQVASGQKKPYVVGHHRPEVVNYVFNGMGMPGHVACFTPHGQQCGTMLLRHWAL
jgi:hypothetical protein